MKKILLLVAIVYFVFGCTTQKRRSDELSGLGKFYHNTTAKYNGYFNANELLMASMLRLEEQQQDNYNKILDLYEYVAADNPKAVAGDLDEAIKKVSIVVNLHRQSVWTDDCYLLLGKAQYLKQDYEAAEETLRYMYNEFSPVKMARKKAESRQSKKISGNKKSSSSSKKSSTSKEKIRRAKEQAKARKKYNQQVKKNKKRKKSGKAVKKPSASTDKKDEVTSIAKEDKPKGSSSKKNKSGGDKGAEKDLKTKEKENTPGNYFLKHRPAYQEGVLWLARTLIERDNYDSAQRLMSQLENDRETFKDVRSELAAVQAYFFLKQKNYERALAPLEKAIELAAERRDKARYSYIAAQIHQNAGRGAEAYAGYERVLKFGTEYEMEFSARLSLAQNAYVSGKGNAEDAKHNLEKMLKDFKNEEYKDQIYYTLAKIATETGDRDGTIEYLKLSLKHSLQNKAQQAEAYLQLAKLYFEDQQYVPASNYYDSTLMVLTTTDERYDQVQSYAANLKEIAENIEIINLQDSLLRISELSEDEKHALALQIMKERDDARRQALLDKSNGGKQGKFNGKNLPTKTAAFSGGRAARPAALQKQSSFFVYNDRSLKRGRKDFERKWGTRILEDNWRRANRRGAFGFEEETLVEESIPSVLTEDEIDKLLGSVPKTEADIRKAHLKIQEAMFALGSLYRDRLGNNENAVGILEELNRRYPGSNYELESWYMLYIIHSGLNNQARAKEYFDKIIDKYPESKFAKLLKDPSYIAEIQDEEHRLNRYYDEAYSAFKTGKYQLAYDKSVGATTKFGAANSLQPKFALLAAMSSGNIQGKDAYMKALTEVVAKYPETAEQKRAKEILRLLGGARAALPGEGVEADTEYKLEDEKLHYIIIVFNEDVRLNDNKNAVSDYNRQYHKLDKLRISNIYLGTDPKSRTPIIVIRRFKNKAEAMKYHDGVQKNKQDFIPDNINYDVFAITQNNYRQVLKAKTTGGYRAFFELNYLD